MRRYSQLNKKYSEQRQEKKEEKKVEESTAEEAEIRLRLVKTLEEWRVFNSKYGHHFKDDL
jgi:hypothetical protein